MFASVPSCGYTQLQLNTLFYSACLLRTLKHTKAGGAGNCPQRAGSSQRVSEDLLFISATLSTFRNTQSRPSHPPRFISGLLNPQEPPRTHPTEQTMTLVACMCVQQILLQNEASSPSPAWLDGPGLCSVPSPPKGPWNKKPCTVTGLGTSAYL